MRILVIGAGASGLVTAKTLQERGHDVTIITDATVIGGTFENKSYKNSRQVSSKYITCFSDFRRPDADSHMTLDDYKTYLEEYAEHFKVVDVIRYKTKVIDIKSSGDGYQVGLQDVVTMQTCDEFWDAVAICSGVHNIPRVPKFEGQVSFAGEVIHSSIYKDPDIFYGKKVLVIGTGETGFDIGYAAATHGALAVTLSTRHGFVSVPTDFGENKPPLDCIIMNWGTHNWESQWAQRIGLHWWITTKFSRLGFLFLTGTTYGFNQWVGRRYNMTWDGGNKHIVNKSRYCMPLLTRKAKRTAPWWQRKLWFFWDTYWETPESVGKEIDLVEGSVEKFGENSVHFSTKNGSRSVETDLVIFATGYRQRFPFMFPPSENGQDDPLPKEHFIISPDEPRLAYIGFVRPNVGAIPPMSELQAMWWAARLEGKTSSQHLPVYYKLKESRIPYGVDYGNYMFALAKEIGVVPSLLHWLWRRPKVALVCGFGQAHIPIFRLQGQFASKDAEDICADELLRPILMRPLLMNAIFFAEAIFFGVINGIAGLCGKASGKVGLTTGICAGVGYLLHDSFKNLFRPPQIKFLS